MLTKRLTIVCLIIAALIGVNVWAATFGLTTDGGEDLDIVGTITYVGFAVAPEDGTTTFVGWWYQSVAGSGTDYNPVVFNNTDGSRIPDTVMWIGATQTGPGSFGTVHDSLSASFTFSSGDTLWVGIYGVGNARWVHDNGAGATDQCRRSGTGGVQSVGDNWRAGTLEWNYTFSSYIIYTPSAGAADISYVRRIKEGEGK